MLCGICSVRCRISDFCRAGLIVIVSREAITKGRQASNGSASACVLVDKAISSKYFAIAIAWHC